MQVALEPAAQPDVERLLRLGEEFALSLYPADECFLLPVSELEKPGVSVFVARLEGEAVGMAALVGRGDGSAELKRLFVDGRARGQGLAGGLLDAVEQAARDAGVGVIQLETGPRSTAAIALYEKRGYRHIPLFGQYVGSGSSVCMEKSL
ncbi:MAG: GNAT family N-acetyltransferase [Rhodoglobus sp.]